MTTVRDSLGFLPVRGSGTSDRAIVVLHGIRQSREALQPFAQMIADCLPADVPIYVYGYDYNLALAENGKVLAHYLASELGSFGRIDLVGYSMGGLVARMAATEPVRLPIDTVVTLATPNLGALSNAQLAMLGQMGLRLLHFISPLWPKAEGVMDLTRVYDIMKRRADEMRSDGQTPSARRYASIPALFYNDERPKWELGPSTSLSGLQAVFFAANLRRKMTNMERMHDGIVTEKSNDLTNSSKAIWNEMRLLPGNSPVPLRAHASARQCIEHDHSSILSEPQVARLVAALIGCENWSDLKTFDPELESLVDSNVC